jgi:hypothetical protein
MLTHRTVSRGNWWFTVPIVGMHSFRPAPRLTVSTGTAVPRPSLYILSYSLLICFETQHMSSGVLLYVSAVPSDLFYSSQSLRRIIGSDVHRNVSIVLAVIFARHSVHFRFRAKTFHTFLAQSKVCPPIFSSAGRSPGALSRY